MKKLIILNIVYLLLVLVSWVLLDYVFIKTHSISIMKVVEIIMIVLPAFIGVLIVILFKNYSWARRSIFVLVSIIFQYVIGISLMLTIGLWVHSLLGGSL